MTVYDLNSEQMEYLKQDYFYNAESAEVESGEIRYFWEVPDEAIYQHYDGIDFVPDDFG